MQLDLFLDGREAILINGLVAELLHQRKALRDISPPFFPIYRRGMGPRRKATRDRSRPSTPHHADGSQRPCSGTGC
jgi:hypothetical protein